MTFGTPVARADEEATGIVVKAPRRLEEEGPLLHLDFSLRPNAEGLGVVEQGKATVVGLPAQMRAVVAGSWWTTEQESGSELDVKARGWRATVELSHDFGWFKVSANASVGHVDSAYERGSYTDLGLSLSKTHRLSRWMLGWISLSVGRRRWLGDKPPPGEADGSTVMLSLGTTFR